MKLIRLSKGKYAKIDDGDFAKVSRYKWHFSNGYAKGYVGGNGKATRLHRFILDAKSNQEIDHINLNGLDNRRCNLRFVNRSKNMANRFSFTKSGLKGIYRQRGLYDGKWKRGDDKWWVYIWNGKEKKLRYLGNFANKKIAKLTYEKEYFKLYGFKPRGKRK